jgi:hypothetical protein
LGGHREVEEIVSDDDDGRFAEIYGPTTLKVNIQIDNAADLYEEHQ